MNRGIFSRFHLIVCLSLAAVLAPGTSASANVRLPSVIDSNMVLQRDIPLPIWGWAAAGEEVTVALGDNKATATADAKGKWSLKLAPMQAGGPHTMTVTGKNSLTLKNILVGEVWVCSGQSNMEWSVLRTNNAQAEAAAAKYPNIRLFHIPKVTAGAPREDVTATWTACTPQSIPSFTAVGYFFGRELHQELDVPIGLIQTAWGGTRIEPWTPLEGFRAVPKVAKVGKQIEFQMAHYLKASTAVVEKYAAWLPQAQAAAKAGVRIPLPPEWPTDPVARRVSPTGLYNGMVHAIVPFGMRGAIWYQGESNLGEGIEYHEKMKALIFGWRAIWAQGDFPFLYVQLAPFRYGGSATRLPGIWEAQTATLKLPNTGMAVTTDIGNVKDIHPKNKQDVGKRLALWALAKTYGREKLVYSGPLYNAMAIEEQKIRVSFEHVGSGLASRDGKPLDWFSVAGADGKFVDAKAEIDGDSVVVSSKQVPAPVAVRFGWHQEAEPNLMNKEGLPASPFRTDQLKTDQ